MICNITRVNEESTIQFTIVFTDKNGVEYDIPSLTSVRYQLSDKDGNVINDRSFANGLITANPVILKGDDLAMGDAGTVRLFAVKIVYDSTLGSGLTANTEEKFIIKDLKNIT